MFFTSEPSHDAAMHDIEMRHEDELTPEEIDRCPYCDICNEHILPGEKYFEFAGFYFHEDCVEWREMR